MTAKDGEEREGEYLVTRDDENSNVRMPEDNEVVETQGSRH